MISSPWLLVALDAATASTMMALLWLGAGVLAVWSRLATGSFTRIFGIIPMGGWVLMVLAIALVAIARRLGRESILSGR